MASFSNGAFRPHATYAVSAGLTPVQSPEFVWSGGVIRIVATEDIYIAVGLDPTATSSSMIIPKGTIEYLMARQGEQVSVLQVSQAGLVSITEIQ